MPQPKRLCVHACLLATLSGILLAGCADRQLRACPAKKATRASTEGGNTCEDGGIRITTKQGFEFRAGVTIITDIVKSVNHGVLTGDTIRAYLQLVKRGGFSLEELQHLEIPTSITPAKESVQLEQIADIQIRFEQLGLKQGTIRGPELKKGEGESRKDDQCFQFAAVVSITLDAETPDHGVTFGDVVRAYLQLVKRRAFSLEELQQLEIPTSIPPAKGSVQLEEIADIQIRFERLGLKKETKPASEVNNVGPIK